MTVGLWKLSSLDGRRPPWYRPLLLTDVVALNITWNNYTQSLPVFLWVEKTQLVAERPQSAIVTLTKSCTGCFIKMRLLWISFPRFVFDAKQRALCDHAHLEAKGRSFQTNCHTSFLFSIFRWHFKSFFSFTFPSRLIILLPKIKSCALKCYSPCAIIPNVFTKLIVSTFW